MKMRLKYWRTRRALTTRELTAKAGVSSSTIAEIERSGKLPRPHVIKRLAEALEVTVEELLVEDIDTPEE